MVAQYDDTTTLTHGDVGECCLWMGTGCLLEDPSCFWLHQPCWYLYKRDVRWRPFLALTRFLHLSSVWLLSAVSLGDSSLASACRAPTTTGSAFCSFSIYFFQQEFVSFDNVLISIILDFGCHFSFIQCRMPYHLFATSGCAIHFDMSSGYRIHPGWILFPFCLGCMDWGCLSVLDPLVVAQSYFKLTSPPAGTIG